MKKNFTKILSFFIFPAFVFCLSFFLNFCFNIYVIFPSVDIPMHFLGGISIAWTSVLFLKFFQEKNYIQIKNKFLLIFIILAFVSFVAVMWEFWEFLVDFFFHVHWQLSLQDTMGDLCMGMLGGLFGGFCFRKHLN